jgi:hypothetical protein
MALAFPTKFDHERLIAHMTGKEVLAEYDHLNSGKAENLDPRKGVKVGLPPELEARQQLLKTHIERCIQECHTVAA